MITWTIEGVADFGCWQENVGSEGLSGQAFFGKRSAKRLY